MELSLFWLFVIFGLALLAVIFLPVLQCGKALGDPKEIFAARNEARKTVAQIIGGLAVLFGFFLTQTQIKATERNLTKQLDSQQQIATKNLEFQQNQTQAQNALERRKEYRRERERIFSELSGLNILRTQLIVSRLNAEVNFDYLEYVWKLQGNPANSVYLEEAQENARLMATLSIDIAKSNQRVFELVQLVPLYYSKNESIRNASRRVYAFKGPAMTDPPAGLQADGVLKWRDQSLDNCRTFAEKEYYAPVNTLLDLLRNELDDDER